MYVSGNGVIQDNVMAYMYFNVARANGNKNKNGVAIRNYIAKEMSSLQIEDAQRLAREWMATH